MGNYKGPKLIKWKKIMKVSTLQRNGKLDYKGIYVLCTIWITRGRKRLYLSDFTIHLFGKQIWGSWFLQKETKIQERKTNSVDKYAYPCLSVPIAAILFYLIICEVKWYNWLRFVCKKIRKILQREANTTLLTVCPPPVAN